MPTSSWTHMPIAEMIIEWVEHGDMLGTLCSAFGRVGRVGVSHGHQGGHRINLNLHGDQLHLLIRENA
jgi:hypothetical protein